MKNEDPGTGPAADVVRNILDAAGGWCGFCEDPRYHLTVVRQYPPPRTGRDKEPPPLWVALCRRCLVDRRINAAIE